MKKLLRFLPLCAFPFFILKLVIVLLLPLFFTGCSSNDEERDAIPASFLRVSDERLEFSDDGGEYELEVLSDGSWMFISKDDWLPSQIRGVGNQKINITAQPNTSGARREATVKVVALNPSQATSRELKVEIDVVQTGKVVEDIVKRDFYLSEKAGERAFSIQSNDDFEIVSLEKWLRVTSKIKLGSFTTFKVNADANLGEQRKGQLKVIYSNKSEIILDAFQWSATSIDIHQEDVGNLRRTFALAGESDATQIVVRGKVSEIDIRFLSQIVESLTVLDMGESEAQFDKLGMDFSNKKATSRGRCVLILPQGLKAIGSSFSRSTLFKDIVIPNSVTEIGSHAFAETSFEKIDWSKTKIRSIQEGAFKRMITTEILLPETLERLGSAVFAGCSNLKKLTLPKSVKEMGIIVFFDCTSLEELILPSALESIDRMLSNNTSLKELTIPNSVKQVRMIYQRKGDDDVLNKMIIEGAPILQEMALDNVTIKELVLKSSTPPPSDEESFMAAPFKLARVEKVIIPAGSLAAYKSAPVWKDYVNYVEQ